MDVTMPTVPNITPEISIDREDAIVLLLSSIAMEEMALSRIIDAEAAKVQFVLQKLYGKGRPPGPPSWEGPPTSRTPSRNRFDELMQINASVRQTLDAVTIKEVLLQMKLSRVAELAERAGRPSCGNTKPKIRD